MSPLCMIWALTQNRTAMDDLEQENDMVRLAVLIDCSGHWRGDSEGRRGWWPKRERTRPELDGHGVGQLPNVLLSPDVCPITGAHDTKLSPSRAEAGLLPVGPIPSLLAQATQVPVCHGEYCVSELISECPNLCLL